MSGNAIAESSKILKENLGITELEASILLPLFKNGNMTVGAIALLLGETLSKVKQTLTRLESKGFVIPIDGIVPLYQAVSPSLALTDSLSAVLEDFESIGKSADKELTSNLELAENTVIDILDMHKEQSSSIKGLLDDHEIKTLELVSSQVDSVSSTAVSVLTSLAEGVESALKSLDTDLETDLGKKLLQLQAELNKSQKTLTKEVRAVSREFKKWLKEERLASDGSMKSFQEKTTALVKKTKSAIESTFIEAESTLTQSLGSATESLNSATSDLITELSETLSELRIDLSTASTELNNELASASTEANTSLSELTQRLTELSDDEIESARLKIQDARDLTSSSISEVKAWKVDTFDHIGTASRSVTSQFEQAASADQSYVEIVRNTLVGHLDKINAMVTEDYSTLSDIATELESNFTQNLDRVKTSMVPTIRSILEKDQKELEDATTALKTELEVLAEKAAKSIKRKLARGGKGLSEIVDSRVAELYALSTKMSKRLKSAFSEVIEKTATANESLITEVTTHAQEFENQVDDKIGAVVIQFAGITDKYVDEAEQLYSGLNTKLDNRVSQTVKSLTSHMDRARTEIEQIINDQMLRIDRQASEIRQEFHGQIEEITRQFINLTQGLEASFNGLLSSQIIETRDFISSTHTEFNNALKSEMVTLKDESLKLQQEYSQEVGIKLDEVRDSSMKMRRTLEEFTSTKRQEISLTIQEAITKMEASMQTTDDDLHELETDTMHDTGEDLIQISEDFKASAANAQLNLSDKLSTIGDAVGNELEKSIIKIGNAAEARFAEQAGLHQRTIASISKSLDSSASKMNKTVGLQLESFQSNLTESQVERTRLRNAARDEAISAVNSRRREATTALDVASVSFSSTLDNLTGAVDTLVDKMVTDIELAGKNLGAAETTILSHLKDRRIITISKVEEIGAAHIQKIASSYKALSTKLDDRSNSSMNHTEERLVTLPEFLTQTIQKSIKEPVKATRDKFNELESSLAVDFAECERSSESIAEEFKSLVDRTSEHFITTQDDLAERIQQSAVLSNQLAARNFESIGLELKTNLSSESYTLIENARNDVAAKSLEISTTVKTAKTAIEEGAATLNLSRDSVLGLTVEKVDKKMRRWVAKQKKTTDTLKVNLDGAVHNIVDSTRATIDTLHAISKARDDLMSRASSRTWYLSGDEEICAHIVDMANRATDSIVISVLDRSYLDLKSLAKVKSVPRKVLIVPESEAHDAELDRLSGWRIWHTQTPVLLAVADDKEILVGGADESESSVIIISTDESYLRLYRDVLGPKLIQNRII